ncbi:Uncharacterised protein [Mycobacteroides abscessus subsp. abscessus]|nr:Uncharacterised protein [Mycobacteroides abscessus subsp. abscessus]
MLEPGYCRRASSSCPLSSSPAAATWTRYTESGSDTYAEYPLSSARKLQISSESGQSTRAPVANEVMENRPCGY